MYFDAFLYDSEIYINLHAEFVTSLQSGYEMETVIGNDMCQIKLINVITLFLIVCPKGWSHQCSSMVKLKQFSTSYNHSRNYKFLARWEHTSTSPLLVAWFAAARDCVISSREWIKYFKSWNLIYIHVCISSYW